MFCSHGQSRGTACRARKEHEAVHAAVRLLLQSAACVVTLCACSDAPAVARGVLLERRGGGGSRRGLQGGWPQRRGAGRAAAVRPGVCHQVCRGACGRASIALQGPGKESMAAWPGPFLRQRWLALQVRTSHSLSTSSLARRPAAGASARAPTPGCTRAWTATAPTWR